MRISGLLKIVGKYTQNVVSQGRYHSAHVDTSLYKMNKELSRLRVSQALTGMEFVISFRSDSRRFSLFLKTEI